MCSLTTLTKCDDQVVSTPALYSGGLWFRFQPGYPEGFPQSLQANAGIVP
jgi:hypothetical protein